MCEISYTLTKSRLCFESFLCIRVDNGKTSNLFTKNLIIKIRLSNEIQTTNSQLPFEYRIPKNSKNFYSINYKDSHPVHCKFDNNFEF